ncbi:dehydrogenase [Pleomassaria siparia CBS 279.74]|uniref:Dehydrogenase n=1 Tax=Pleomassaria siparia CBS 279.74 TaxID=1314801 RepID=A0A6G1KMQ5_9PLEO|nr:dehydrogenase [Pleomassaria siparia CBS 279.74]
MAKTYDAKSTASEVAAAHASIIAGKVVLATGVSPNSLGAQFVETIAHYKPSLLILAGRSAAKVQATADKIKANFETANVETRVLILDLASQVQIREAAKEVLTYPETNIDVVVNSAGIMGGPYSKTKDGLESQFGANYIGHFLFTNLIMLKILASKSPRIVNVSSKGHEMSSIRFDDYNFKDGKTYNQWYAYGQSKTGNILFTKALTEKLGPKGLKAYSLHPGVTFGTSLAQGLGEEDFKDMSLEFSAKTLDECAATHVVAAFDPRLDDHNGAYLVDGNVAGKDGVGPTADKAEDVEKLWKLSEDIVGERFPY